MATKKTPAKKPAAKKPRVTVSAAKEEVKETRPVGRPSSFKPEFVERAYEYSLLGASDEQMAEFFGVIPQTFYNWKQQHPEFLEALSNGKHIADAKVTKSLYQRAIGYEHPEDDIRTVSIGGGRSDIVITPMVKRYPPDTAAATLWLKNRQPKLWRDKVDIEHGGTLKLESLPDDVLKDRMAELMARMKLK